MSEILSNIIVENNNINFVPTVNNIVVTPEPIGLSIYSGASGGAGNSSQGQLLYNNLNLIEGLANVTYANGNLSLGDVANVKITGGNNAYYLQTDGAGNLSWVVGAGNVTGNGVAAGANTQIQFTDGSGNFQAAAGFTFNNVSNTFSAPGQANITGNLNQTGNINLVGNVYSNTAIVFNSNAGIRTTAGNIALGSNAGSNAQGITSIAIGANAGANTQAYNAIAIGANAATTGQNVYAIAMGTQAGESNQYQFAIAIGTAAGSNGQQENAIAIGKDSAIFQQGKNSVAIGANAGNQQAANSIVLNATGSPLTANTSNTFIVKPIRSNTGANLLYYDNTSGEITYGTATIAQANTVTDNAQPNITSVGTLVNVNVSGQIISTVANGTAPLTLLSTTKVANLNADLLDGYDTSTSATANTVAVRTSGGNLAATFFIGNGSALTGITVATANTANYANIANNLAPISGVGNITGTFNFTPNNTAILGATTARANSIYSDKLFAFSLSSTGGANLSVTNGSGESILLNNSNNDIRMDVSTQANAIVIDSSTAILKSDKAASSAVDTTISYKIPIVLNGVTYYIALTTNV